MDPTTPAPDDSERPARHEDEADRAQGEEAGAQDRESAVDGHASSADDRGLSADDRESEAEDSAAAQDRAADDGWAAEGESRPTDAEQTAELGPDAGATSSSAGTNTWRGPEATGRTPASMEPDPSGESGPSDESAPSGGGTSDWRGPEATGRTPASIEPAPSGESGPSDESGPSAESAPSGGGTSDWRGPETAGRTPASIEPAPSGESGPSDRGPEATGWTPQETRLAPPEQHAAERTQESRAADRGLPPPDDLEHSETAGPADGEPTRTERVPAGFSFFNRARSDDHDSDEDADSAYSPSEHLRVQERPRRLPERRGESAAPVRADPAEICPFLVAASGGWRLAVPSREHRCGAVNPPSPLSPQKQTRLCLTEGHLRCATFLAAGATRESRVGSAAMPDRVSRWALARTTPVVEEVGGVRTTLAGLLADRRRWPAIPAMLLVVALATLGLSSLRGGGTVTALASPSPQPTDVPVPTVSIAPTPSVAPTPEPSPTAAPSPSPTPAPTPAPTHATYTVVSGDTLGAIAKQFGTTVQALMDLNGITDPGRLSIGQVLQIP
jgi:LysM repeat protein